MDVKGGMILGLVVALVAYNLCDAFDAFMLGTPHVGVLLLAFASSVLILILVCDWQLASISSDSHQHQ